MMNKIFSKLEIEEKIKNVFSRNPKPEDIKKLKKLIMSKNIKLTSYKILFCKKCLTFFNSKNSIVRIKNPFKTIKCNSCGNINRYKIKRPRQDLNLRPRH